MVSPEGFWSSGAGSCVGAAPFFSSGTIDFDDPNIVESRRNGPVARGLTGALFRRLRSTTLCGLWHSDGNDVGPIARSFDQEAAAVRARARSRYLQTTRNKPRRPRRC